MSNISFIQQPNVPKRVHCFFYNYNSSGQLQFLLTKSDNDEHFTELSSSISDEDFSPIISISREITFRFRGLFKKAIFDKLQNNEHICEDDLDELLPWYKVHHSNTMTEWM